MRLRRLFHTSLLLLINAQKVLSIPASTTRLALIEAHNPQVHPRSLPQQTPVSLALQPRIPPHYAYAGWTMALFDQHLVALSIAGVIGAYAALAILVRLYSNILDNCLSNWASSPPRNQVVIEAGNLRLEFGCSMEPVPWDFIEEFARSYRDAVNRGFAPVFARKWWFDNRDRRRLCYAGLRVVPDGGMAVQPEKDGG